MHLSSANDNVPVAGAAGMVLSAPPYCALSDNYYNEIDPFAAQWLRNLIRDGHIAPGDVDERSIVDVRPADLTGYTQCHFFAGIGVWSAALRASGWPDTRRIWTASCPCQPFSAAGKGGGFDDERHLWPALQWLIQQCRPDTVFGEQVASKDGLGWLDLVSTDLEAMGYACGAVPSPAAGIGAPHIRQRLYWVADATFGRRREECADIGRNTLGDGSEGRPTGFVSGDGVGGLVESNEGRWRSGRESGMGRQVGVRRNDTDTSSASTHTSEVGSVAQPDSWQLAGKSVIQGAFSNREDVGRPQGCGEPESYCADGRLANTRSNGGEAGLSAPGQWKGRQPREFDNSNGQRDGDAPPFEAIPAYATDTFWSDADWIWCRDSKYRPVEPGSFPLAHGLARGMGTLGAELRGLAEVAGLDGKSLARAKKHRIGSLKGYGNAIVRQHAQAFIAAYLETVAEATNDNTTNKDTSLAA